MDTPRGHGDKRLPRFKASSAWVSRRSSRLRGKISAPPILRIFQPQRRDERKSGICPLFSLGLCHSNFGFSGIIEPSSEAQFSLILLALLPLASLMLTSKHDGRCTLHIGGNRWQFDGRGVRRRERATGLPGRKRFPLRGRGEIERRRSPKRQPELSPRALVALADKLVFAFGRQPESLFSVHFHLDTRPAFRFALPNLISTA